nr:hypothetical protein [Tanacetum cinerariifolium]
MWEIIKRLMKGSDISQQERHSRLINEFDKFMAIKGESLTSMYERFSTLINVMDQNEESSNYAGNGFVQSIEEYDQNVQRNLITELTLGKTNVQCYNCNGKGHYARECPKPRVHDAKYFREQILLALKEEAEAHLYKERNDIMLDNAYGDNTLEELNVAVIMIAYIQPTDDKSDAKSTYDAEFISEVYDPHLKTGLGYENLEHLKKAIKAQPKIYDGEKLKSTKLKVNLPNYNETFEDAKENRLKMIDKMIQLDYAKLNALYESFVPQTEIPVEQTYFSSPSTSNVSTKSSLEKSDLPPKKMPNESKLLKLFIYLDNEIKQLGKLIDNSIQRKKERTVIYDA